MSAMTRATTEEIIVAYKETGSVWKAAKLLGICGQSVHERLKRIGYRLSILRWTSAESDEALLLSSGGLPIGKVAERLGRTYASVACKLSELGVKNTRSRTKKPKRGAGWTKITANKLIDRALTDNTPITKIARQLSLPTTDLVNAIQFFAPLKWQTYVQEHSTLDLKVCSGCKREFIPLTKKQKYCTGACGGRSRSDVEYFGGNRLNAVGMKEGVCQLCAKEVSKGLSAHHAFGKERDPDNNFLIALCQGCHHLVGNAAGRRGALDQEFWENFISLVVMRAGGFDPQKSGGTHITVDIEYLTPEDVEEMQETA